MTTREIPGHIGEIYGVEASPRLISAITDTVMEEVTAWQNRLLAPCYLIVFMDPIRVNIRTDEAVANKAIFRGPCGPAGRHAGCSGAVVPRLMKGRSFGPRS